MFPRLLISSLKYHVTSKKRQPEGHNQKLWINWCQCHRVALPFESKLLPAVLLLLRIYRYCPKGVFGKGFGNIQNASEMRQKCVRNGSCFTGKRGTSKMRQKSVKIVSEMRQKSAEHLWGRTPFGRYRIYFPKITVSVTVLKFGWINLITITVTVLASAVTPSLPLVPNYHLESHLN